MPSVPAHWYRGGTSKCWFFDHDALSAHAPDRTATAAVLAAAFGADDPRHIDGVGGATSTTAKAAIIRRTPEGDCDLDYLFAQVGIGTPEVEFTSNCGNCATAVGLYAVTEGIVPITGDITAVRMWNENTNSVVEARVHTPGGQVPQNGDAVVPGTQARGVPVDLVFPNPGGAVTGHLLPAGGSSTELLDDSGRRVTATLVDAGAPAALIKATDLGLTGCEDIQAFEAVVPDLVGWRRRAALAMGLATASDPISHAVPKVGIVGAPQDYVTTTGEAVAADDYDLAVRMVSMLAPHPAIGLTSAVAVAAALQPGSTVADVLGQAPGPGTHTLRLGTFAGVVRTDVEIGDDGHIIAVSLRRAARRIAVAAIDLPSR